jgi:hypothetical protein
VLPHVGDVLKASSALNDSWPKSKQMTRRQCRPIPADAPLLHPNPPIRMDQERLGGEGARMMSMARRIQKMEDRLCLLLKRNPLGN